MLKNKSIVEVFFIEWKLFYKLFTDNLIGYYTK